MKILIATLSVLCLVQTAIAEIHDVRYGTFEAPEDFVFKHTGTLDSFMGTLTRKSDGFAISFDIGLMAGVHMYEAKEEKCAFYRLHKINDNFAFTGIENTNGTRLIITTIYDQRERGRGLSEKTHAALKLPEPEQSRQAQLLNTQFAELNKDHRAPANFWATVKSDAEVAEFLLIVATYKPNPGP